MKSLLHPLPLVTTLACFVLLPGCFGGGDTPDLADVSGVVTLDGKPLAEATVLFQPLSGRPSAGTTDQDGKFRLRYTASETGAKIGDHKVIIRKEVAGKDRGGESVWKETVPDIYNQRTTLTATVEPGTNTINFELPNAK
ncbi:carboxypeptidase-like regulatory domain-containing protein [Blastopirellula marina]|uniref:Carboxypeptidase regulatory-like domain-containing protein n=1 Tax=Blastopirellula marina TaxID=124 RepID=A0A2S8G2D5_9BACT|nr:carboxypeptidase-like regulatory domain-containing protein [Blastopirellula marina]PQO38605.1 hypothetical protein C5Y98_11200 [Blastopirellula marina]PTL45262.1 carboxypeptidase regulatory-like domain-containing protein [Blastopirellula marina]